MPLILIRNDITRMRCDAIVNAANNSLLGGGGVDGAIHAAAGPELLAECRTLGGCATGEAKITKGYRLPAKYVIHTVGPAWQDGMHGEPALLRSCYLNSLQLAAEYGCESVAFPLISSGVYGYPKEKALGVARESILDFLAQQELTVYLVVFDRSAFRLSTALAQDIAQYIDDAYAAAHANLREPAVLLPFDRKHRLKKTRIPAAQAEAAIPMQVKEDACSMPDSSAAHPAFGAGAPDLDALLAMRDESFSQMLLRKIGEAGITDAACYKKANVDRKLFSKIRSDVHYKPSKQTAIAFAIALELSPEETDELLRKAGFALSNSSVFDLIISFFIRRGNYNIFDINEALFAYDQPLLGA